jgi:hypothetical protein
LKVVKKYLAAPTCIGGGLGEQIRWADQSIHLIKKLDSLFWMLGK